MPIRQLEPHVAELIAAGEVVERPASVVKELVENALDAGATSVTVEIRRGGIQLIRVQDDGSGIPGAELPLAFVRHATSKVAGEEDLEAIETLGFRGEALASISSVAQVELLSRHGGEEDANLFRMAGGAEQGRETAARPRGTTITVNNLFYNTPARMKFLKKDSSEATFVTETVGRLALSHPEVAFRYLREDKLIFQTPGDGDLAAAAWAVLGANFARGLLQVEGGKDAYRVVGLVTPPLASRASRSMQYFYINGRFVKNRTMMAALEQAYRGTTMQGKFPGCVLFLEMPPELVDVNVHPAKTEVRFARESDVFDAVYRAVKDCLLGSQGRHGRLMPEPEKETTPAAEAPVPATPVPPPAPAKTTVPAATPWKEGPAQRPEPADGASLRSYSHVVETLASEAAAIPYESRHGVPREVLFPTRDESPLTIEPEAEAHGLPPAAAPKPPAEAPPQPEQQTLPGASTDAAEELRMVGEVFSTYIIAQAGETLLLIDKHAAHERLLYEELVKRRSEPDIQQLLQPLSLSLSAGEKEALLQNSEALLAAGIEVEDFGGGSVLVRGVPSDIEVSDVEGLVCEVAARLETGSQWALNEKTEWVLHSIACRAAVKAGDRTPPGQLLYLAAQIHSGAIPPFCPHGRPVVLEMTRKELEKQFGRLGG